MSYANISSDDGGPFESRLGLLEPGEWFVTPARDCLYMVTHHEERMTHYVSIPQGAGEYIRGKSPTSEPVHRVNVDISWVFP